jgi:hypothetical protein
MMVKIGFVAIAVTPDWSRHSTNDRRWRLSPRVSKRFLRVMSEVRLRLVEGPTLFIREPRLDPEDESDWLGD